jgi:uroporphyrinogen decarboxylase
MRAPDKQRIFDAIAHKQTSEVPFLEIDPDMHLVNLILERKRPMELHSFELEAEDNIELNTRMGNDLTFFGHVWRVGRKEFKDKVGRIHYIDGNIKTREQMDQIWFPDLKDLERRLEDHCKSVQGSGMGIMCKAQTPAFTTMCAMGYTDYLTNTMMDPDFVMDFTKRIHEYCMKELEVFLKYPVDIIQLSSGLVTNSAPMVDPEQMEILETQFIRELMKQSKQHGKKVFFHIDGKIDDMIPDFVEMGVDVLNPIDLCAGNQDIYKIKEQYGDIITLSGNIDIEGVLNSGTPDEVKADVIEHIERCAVGGGYIVSSCHNLHEMVPIDNFYAMRDATINYKLS